MDRLVQRNVLALSGRAVEAAGDCRRAPARQDRHDHARQPPGDRADPRAQRHAGAACRRGAALEPRRRNARRTLDRRPREGAVRPPRARPRRRRSRPVLRPHAHERHRSRRPLGAEGRSRRDRAVDRRRTADRVPPELQAAVDAIGTSGGTPLVVAESGRARRRRPPEGRRQGGYARAIRRDARGWASGP